MAHSDGSGLNNAYRWSVQDVIADLNGDARLGLTEAEARARLAGAGPNELASEKAQPAWRRFLTQFQDVLVILLLIATTISAGLWVVERDAPLPYEAIAIFAVVLLNAIMGSSKNREQRRQSPRCVRCLRRTRRSCGTANDEACRHQRSYRAMSFSSKKATRFPLTGGSSNPPRFKQLKQP